MKRLLSLAVLAIAVMTTPRLHADAVTANFTASGTSGNWTLNFTVTNNIVAGDNVYFFGVYDPTGTVTGTPNGWINRGTWNNSSFGGSNTNYNDVWIAGSIPFGSSLSGFVVHDTSAILPTSFQFFAYGSGTPYNGPHFNSSTNPGFEGTTGGSVSPVPEPSSLALFGTGVLGVFGAARRKFSL